jgi:hypothetical protein
MQNTKPIIQSDSTATKATVVTLEVDFAFRKKVQQGHDAFFKAFAGQINGVAI